MNIKLGVGASCVQSLATLDLLSLMVMDLIKLNWNCTLKTQGPHRQQGFETAKGGQVFRHHGPGVGLETSALFTACGLIRGAPEGQELTPERQEQNSFPTQHVPPITVALALTVCNWLEVVVAWCSFFLPRQASLLYLFEDYRALACL